MVLWGMFLQSFIGFSGAMARPMLGLPLMAV